MSDLDEGNGHLVQQPSQKVKSMLARGVSFAAIERRLADPNCGFGKMTIPLVPAEGVCLYYGKSGSFKTFLAIQNGLQLAALGRAVAYFAAEDFFGAQVRALAAAKAAGLESVPFRVFPLETLIFADDFVGDVLTVAKSYAADALSPLGAIFIDTYGAACGAMSQDDAGQTSLAMLNLHRLAAETKGPIIATHHPGKDTGKGMRGSQVIFDRADVVVEISRPQRSNLGLVAKVQKFRNGTEGEVTRAHLAPYNLDCGGIEHKTLVVRSIDPAEREAAKHPVGRSEASDRPKNMFRVTPDARRGMQVLQTIAAGRASIPTNEWREAVYADPMFSEREKAAKRQAFLTMRKNLATVGFISVDDGLETVSVSKREDA